MDTRPTANSRNRLSLTNRSAMATPDSNPLDASRPVGDVAAIGSSDGLACRSYTADVVQPDSDPLQFTVEKTNDEDQPWSLLSELGYETHHTLDELLWWNLICGERLISERLRKTIRRDFGEAC